MYIWCERSVALFSRVANLPLNCASLTKRSNAKSWDWVARTLVTLENLDNLPSIDYERCDLEKSLN